MTSDTQKRSIGSSIARGGIAIIIAHILFKFAGLLQLMVLGRYLSPGTFDAAYVVAFQGCILSVFLIGEEMIGPAFLPVFMRQLDTEDENSAWRFANVFMTIQLLILLVAVFVMVFFPDQIIRLLTDWSRASDPKAFSLARACLVGMAPAVVCLSLGSTTYMLLNGYKRFFLAAFGDAAWKFCVLAAVAVGMGIYGLDYTALVFGLCLGSIAKLVTHLFGLLREIPRFRFSLDLRNPALKSVGLLMLPLVAGILFARVRDIYTGVTVLSSLHTEGLMQANAIGRKLYSTIGHIVPYAFSIAMFPFFCELVDRGDKKKFGEVLSNSGRMLLSVLVPLAVVVAVLAKQITFVLFSGGEFGAVAVHRTAVSMACYMVVLPAYALEFFLMQAFFANRKMVAVVVTGVVFSMVAMLISRLGVVTLGAKGIAALMVIALGFALSRTLKVATLILILKRRVGVPFFPLRETAWFLVRIVAVTIASTGLCMLFSTGVERFVGIGPSRLSAIFQLGAGGVGALAGFLISTYLLRVTEPLQMLKWALSALSRRNG